MDLLSVGPFHFFFLLLLAMASFSLVQAQDAVDDTSFFSACDRNEYYQGVLDTSDLTSWSRESLQVFLEETHRQRLPYTDSNGGGDDVWKALQDIDAAEPMADGSPTVRLIYSQMVVPAEPKGTPETWNREHCWPKSRGVGESGEDFTDVHHLFPADWGVNSLRNNRFFDWCNITSCSRLRDDQLAGPEVDTYFEKFLFQPPFMVRGDVARALFYMNIRYPYLQLTDCPDENNYFQMAYLSTLLEWHALDPPSDEERERNDRVCSRWQGNRNPFVDFPDLVQELYGSPQERPFSCAISTQDPTPTPSSGDGDSSENATAAQVLKPGDVMVVALHSDDPDLVALVAMTNISAGTELHISDNAWDGYSFYTNEGTISLTLSRSISAGTVFGYGDGLLFGTQWVKTDAGFALATAGDSILISYSLPTFSGETDTIDEEEEDMPTQFLTGFSYSGPWSSPFQSVYATSTSSLPVSLENFSVALPHFDNYAYVGSVTGTKASLQKALTNPSNWEGMNSLDSPAILRLQSQSFEITDLAVSTGTVAVPRRTTVLLLALLVFCL